jgi:hypothetical protein
MIFTACKTQILFHSTHDHSRMVTYLMTNGTNSKSLNSCHRLSCSRSFLLNLAATRKVGVHFNFFVGVLGCPGSILVSRGASIA